MPTTAADVPLPSPPQPSGQGASPFGAPRRVSTVSVKPDGTIVQPPKAAASDNSSASPSQPKRVTLASADPGATPAADHPTSPATPAPKKLSEPARPKPAADAEANKPAAKPKPRVADTTPAPQAADDAAGGGPLSITPQGHHRRTVVASADPAASPREAAPTQPNAVHGDSGFSIQLASSPSESDARATLSRLQRQFPSALGGGSVRRANLGAKGIYYRVRVGPLTRDAADKLCSQIRAGGADCILTRG
jgi:hypothetical protein